MTWKAKHWSVNDLQLNYMITNTYQFCLHSGLQFAIFCNLLLCYVIIVSLIVALLLTSFVLCVNVYSFLYHYIAFAVASADNDNSITIPITFLIELFNIHFLKYYFWSLWQCLKQIKIKIVRYIINVFLIALFNIILSPTVFHFFRPTSH